MEWASNICCFHRCLNWNTNNTPQIIPIILYFFNTVFVMYIYSSNSYIGSKGSYDYKDN